MHMNKVKRELDASSIRAIAIDMDGTTLRHDTSLPEANRAALASCLDKGLAVIIATGRSPQASEKYRDAIGASGPMVFYNGAAVIDAPSGKLLASTLLAGDIVSRAVSIARFLDVHIHAFLPDDRLVFEKRRADSDYYEDRTGLRGEIVDMQALFTARSQGVIKAMFIAEPPLLDKIQKEMDGHFGSRIYMARSHATFLEVMAAGVSKGQALGVALALRGIKAEQTIAFGDAENDLPLLEAAGYAVAVANAVPSVLSYADALTLTNEENGVAEFLKKYLL
ncbi:sugar-phosphatase [Treponema sp.]